MFLNGFL